MTPWMPWLQHWEWQCFRLAGLKLCARGFMWLWVGTIYHKWLDVVLPHLLSTETVAVATKLRCKVVIINIPDCVVVVVSYNLEETALVILWRLGMMVETYWPSFWVQSCFLGKWSQILHTYRYMYVRYALAVSTHWSQGWYDALQLKYHYVIRHDGWNLLAKFWNWSKILHT